MSLKKEILDVVDSWIGLANDDLCYYLDPGRSTPLTKHDIRNVNELYQRRIDLIKFRIAFRLDIETGEDAYSHAMLAEVVSAIISSETTSSN